MPADVHPGAGVASQPQCTLDVLAPTQLSVDKPKFACMPILQWKLAMPHNCAGVLTPCFAISSWMLPFCTKVANNKTNLNEEIRSQACSNNLHVETHQDWAWRP